MTANEYFKKVGDSVIFFNEIVHSKTKLNNKIDFTFYIKRNGQSIPSEH